MSKTVLFQAIQFSISSQFSSIWPIDRTLSGAISPGQRGPKSNSSEGVLFIARSSSITGNLSSYCFVSYPGHLLGGVSYPSAEVQSITAPADWVIIRMMNVSIIFLYNLLWINTKFSWMHSNVKRTINKWEEVIDDWNLISIYIDQI